MSGFCPSRMRVARMRRGLSVTDMAVRMGFSRASVSSFEAGRAQPSDAAVRTMASVLGFPEAFFYAGDVEMIDPADGRPARRYATSVASFRALRSLSAEDRDKALAAGVLAGQITEFLSAKLTLPAVTVPDLEGEPPELASEIVRAEWGLGGAPIVDLVGHLEARGVRVFWLVQECREVDAFAFWTNRSPFVLLSRDKTGERVRFDAGHELGHLVLHRHGDVCGRKAETEANSFASALLMPAMQFRRECPREVTLASLMPLKRRWRVSLAAVVRRCFDLGIVSEWHYRSLCIELARMGRTQEPEPMAMENSILFPKAFEALKALGLRPPGIADRLHLPWTDFADLVGPAAIEFSGAARPSSPPPALRLVN